VHRKRSDDKNRPKGRLDGKPLLRIFVSTFNSDSAGVKIRVKMHMETASPRVAAISITNKTLSLSRSAASPYFE
jgi:hypothetical protein